MVSESPDLFVDFFLDLKHVVLSTGTTQYIKNISTRRTSKIVSDSTNSILEFLNVHASVNFRASINFHNRVAEGKRHSLEPWAKNKLLNTSLYVFRPMRVHLCLQYEFHGCQVRNKTQKSEVSYNDSQNV